MDIEQQSVMISELSDLLQKQIAAARKGDYNSIESMIVEAEHLVEKLKNLGAFQNPQFNDKKHDIANLYRKLELAVAAEKNSIEKQKKQVLSTRNVLTAYTNA